MYVHKNYIHIDKDYTFRIKLHIQFKLSSQLPQYPKLYLNVIIVVMTHDAESNLY